MNPQNPNNTPVQKPTTEPQLSDDLGHTPEEKKKENIKSILSTVGLLLLAPLIAIILTVFVFQSYEVDGPSMERTLQNQDRLIVLKLPRTWSRITRHAYMPKRGEVIIFDQAESDFESEARQLIKRVIGLPGDRVVVKDGKITVYNQQNPSGFDPDKDVPWSADVATPTIGNIDLTIQEGEIYVCGDNRTNSEDSRAFGPIKSKDVVGKLILRLFPLSKTRRF